MTKESDFREYADWRKRNNQEIGGHTLWMDVWAGNWAYHGNNCRPGIVDPADTYYDYQQLDRRLHQKLGQPILWKKINNGDDTFSLVMPNLSRIIGFSGLYPAAKLYRDIYNFLQARRQTTDNDPPVGIDNESRILKHGFDLKKSFRHPLNARKKPRRGRKNKSGDEGGKI